MDDSDEDYFYEDEYCEDDDHDLKQLPSSTPSSCKVITKESLLAAQREDLERVMDMLSLKERHARTLLIHYQWDVIKVFDVYVNKGKEALYAEACLMIPEDHDISSLDLSSEVLCEICIEEIPTRNMIKMDCNHSFCNICWTKYFVVKINEGETRRLNCMAYDCYTICDEEKVRTLVKDYNPFLAQKFDRFLLESYIEDNKRVKGCQSVPHCGNAIRIDNDDEYREVECACGFQFCFSCSSEPHSPCSCRMLELWKEKCSVSNWDFSWNAQFYNCFRAYKDFNIDEIGLKQDLNYYLCRMEQPTGSSSQRQVHPDYCWVSNVVDRFFISRQVLSYSYVFAYFMFVEALFSNQMTIEDKETKKKLLEDRQSSLGHTLRNYRICYIYHFITIQVDH